MRKLQLQCMDGDREPIEGSLHDPPVTIKDQLANLVHHKVRVAQHGSKVCAATGSCTAYNEEGTCTGMHIGIVRDDGSVLGSLSRIVAA